MPDNFSARFEKALLKPCLTCKRRREEAEAAAEAAGAQTTTLLVRDRASDHPLPGAAYRIVRDGHIEASVASTLDGRLNLPPLQTGRYALWSTAAPHGFVMEMKNHQLVVDANGVALIDGVPAEGHVLFAQVRMPVSQTADPPALDLAQEDTQTEVTDEATDPLPDAPDPETEQ